MAFLVGSWWDLLPAPWAATGLTLIALVAGGVVGAERERREKPAGLRTLILVCVGSAAFTMASYSFTTTTGDSGRVAAQIVTGIGFLGGGVILRETAGVTGTTTAATIWVTAAAGMVAGAGWAGASLALAALVRTTLEALYVIEDRWVADVRALDVDLTFHPDHGKTRLRIERMLVDFDARFELLALDETSPDAARARFRLRLARRHGRELLAELASFPEMHEIREVPAGSPA